MCRTANGADSNFGDSYANNIRSVIDNGSLSDNMFSAAQKIGRGNIAPTTIILPTLAMQAKDKVEKLRKKDQIEKNEDWSEDKCIESYVNEFMKLLDKKIHEAKDSLIDRFDWISSQPDASAKFMYENGTMYGYKPEEGIKSALKHGTLAIGQLGMAETLQILIGCDHGQIMPKKDLSKEDIIKKMIENLEMKNNRKLSDDEISEIKQYVNNK